VLFEEEEKGKENTRQMRNDGHETNHLTPACGRIQDLGFIRQISLRFGLFIFIFITFS